MAKSHKYAVPIIFGLMIVAVGGVILGVFVNKSALLIACTLLPVAIYEVYRTEGVSTKVISSVILVLVVTEIILLIGNTSVNLAGYVAKGKQMFYKNQDILHKLKNISRGDISMAMLSDVLSKIKIPWKAFIQLKLVIPVVQAIASVFLFRKTFGPYTRWLAAIILISSFAIVYVLLPNLLGDIIKDVLR